MADHDEIQDFVREAGRAQPGLLREAGAWLRHNKKWWLAPIVMALIFVGFLVVVSGSAVAPIIYTLF
jgi:membrane glycosyltransferase